ncbi:two-component regulator propeller domain-containing protein [uncultured Formosa sp.]|uniref:hybrid sensor histidine kinase/response regulator transcription factor n=1 Tax=uncultured Formosa sp. TaxID=255435 RepID=UPI00262668A4|nr:two-component regulator propeller domain-containing protein [uncultured Formosa sp.]
MKKTHIFTIISVFICLSGFAQHFNFKHLSVKDGLVSNMVHTTIQDSDGFMWFGTEDGLSRYDGYSFLNFFQSPTDTLSLSNNLILTLAEDKNKQLWIGTHQGLNMLDLETYKITRFNTIFKESLGSITIQSLYVDDDTLWIGTDNSGLYSLDINTYTVNNYGYVEDNKNSINSNTINCIGQDSKGNVLVGTNQGLDVFNKVSKTFTHLLKDVSVVNVHLQRDGTVLLGMRTEAYYIQLKDDFKIKKVPLPLEFLGKEINLFSDSSDNLWFSVRDQGLLYVDKRTKNTHRLLYNKNNTIGINSNVVTNIFEDAFGNIWFSSLDSGLNILDKRRKEFIHVKDNNLPNGLLNNRVRAVFQDSDRDIWVGTKVGGTLSKFNRDSLTFTHYHSNPSNPLSLSNDFVFSITEDRPGYLWVGTLDGLNFFDKANGTFKVYRHQENNVNSLSSNSINDLLKYDDNLFIGTVTEGLDVYNTKNKRFSHYRKTGANNQLSDNRIKVIYQDQRKNIWIGTINGLNLFDPKTGEFQQFLSNSSDENSISENYILSIHEDKNQNLWVGTSLGINLMDRKTNTFKVYTTKDGLAGNSVKGILEDNEGNLWISTNNGLSKFNTKTKQFKNYNLHDGLQANEFSPFVYSKMANGEMFFGGNNGFNIFNPKDITNNTLIPNVLLTDFKLFNQSVPVDEENSPLKKQISKTENLVLDHKQSVFSFEFVALNYTSPEKNEYAYMMEGFDENWNYIGNKREATYTNLDAGDYIFKVKAANNDGYWNEVGTTLNIKILPAPWFSWWAYMLYSMALVSVFLWFRHNAIKRNNLQKEQEINDLKIKFFGNISHEFRTPLTLILGPLEKILKGNHDASQTSQLRLMSRHTKRLLNLVNQLLDFQKIGSGELKVHTATGDLVQFIRELSYLFVELSNEKDIQFEFETDVESCQTMFDYDKIEKIIFNLLSNAFKFTPQKGHVSITLGFNKEANTCCILVSDDGIGIPKDQLKTIFKRFYQVDHSTSKSNQGSGIGLALTKEYVDLLGGEITVESSLGAGACFKVEMPLVELKNVVEQEMEAEDILQQHDDLEADEHKKQNKKTPLILLVEDNGDLRGFLKDNLNKNYRIIEALNGVEGLKQTLKYIPDLIISDVMMPEMDGNEMCSQIKNDSRISHIPIVLLTAQISEEQQVTGFKNGADQYLTKPFSFDVLISRINSLLAQRKALQSVFSKKIEVNPSEITVTSVDEQLIQKALDLVENNISNSKYSVDELSKSLDISRGHLYRKIVSITGKSPSEFIKSIRLKRSAQLLQSSKLTVSEIAYKVGFSSPKYFSKCFKAEFNMLPTEFTSKYNE